MSKMSTESSIDPNSMGSLEEDMGVQPNVHMLLKVVILGVIGVVSVIGNLIAFGTLFYHRRLLRQPMYIIIGGLAFADIIITVMFVPENIINHLEKGHVTSDTWCKMYGFLYNSCQYISAFHLVVLAVLRGVLLTDRSHHGPRAVHAIITSIILWLTALLANIPVISLSILHNFTNKCAISFGDQKQMIPSRSEDSSVELYTLLSAAFSYFLPLILMFIIYILTGYMSKRYFEDSYSPRERRLSKMITYLILCFTFCRLPLEMVNLLFFYQTKNTDFLKLISEDTYKYAVWVHVLQYLQILAMLDQAFRPIIYATMSREFGKMYDQIINCTICKDEDDDVMTTRLRCRGRGIEEVLHTPLHPPIEIEEYIEPEPEEIM